MRPTLIFLSHRDVELCFAGVAWIVEGFSAAIALGGLEKEATLQAIGDSDEASFPVGVGADFQVELVQAHEAVSDVNVDLCGVYRCARSVGDGDICRARAGVSINDGNSFGIRRAAGAGLRKDKRTGKNEKNESESQFSKDWFTHQH